MKKVIVRAILLSGLLFVGGIYAEAQNLKYVCPDINKEPCVTAKKIISAGQFIVLGTESEGSEWLNAAEGMLSGPCSNKGYEQKIKDGLKLSDATNFWKCYLASPFSGDGTRMLVAKRVYLKVYGTYPTTEQSKSWLEQMNQQKAWFTTMVLTEQGKLHKDNELRKKVIDSIYRRTMNRGAKPADTDYWLARNNDYEQMFVAARKFLYSEAGAKDLHDTIKLAYWVRNQKYPTEDEIKMLAEKYKSGKLIYLEMIGKQADYIF